MDKIAFIGLGNMGAPMAKNLLKAGLNVEVFDLNPNAVEELTALGASSADSVKKPFKVRTWSLPCCLLANTFKAFILVKTGS